MNTETNLILIKPEMIPLKNLVQSPTNPRVHFRADAMEVLENSMRERGFTMSAMLVRPLPDIHYVDSVHDDQHFLMRKINGGEEAVKMFVTLEAAHSGRPFLGICVGMQLLFTESEENLEQAGGPRGRQRMPDVGFHRPNYALAGS